MNPNVDAFVEGVHMTFVDDPDAKPQPGPEHSTLSICGGSYEKAAVDTTAGAFATEIRTDKPAPSPSGATQLSNESLYRTTFTHCVQPPGKPDRGPPISTMGGKGSDTLRVQPADTDAATTAPLQPQDVGDPGMWYPKPAPDTITRVPPEVGTPAEAEAA